jgi:hypothetical protein
MGQFQPIAANRSRVFSRKFGEPAIVPLIFPAAKQCGTIAIDGAPGKSVWPTVVGSLSKARVTAAQPEILAT